MRYMLDTNICVALIRKKSKKLTQKIVSQPSGIIGLSVVTVAELMYGTQKSVQPKENRIALEQFLLPFEVAEFGLPASREYGILRAYLEKSGNIIGSMDMLIGAHALSLDVVLVTNNTKEFKRIPHLKIEDWM
ncbi:MAG: type II toxin-antitoxin system VapC family toxin [Anaerolineales bacterium]